jgi:hypothetical protein
MGESSIVERLVTEGTGITVVVLDTKVIPPERKIIERQPRSEKPPRRFIEEKELILKTM